jgi:hypothetical protein
LKDAGAVVLPVFTDDERKEIVRILSGRGRDPKADKRYPPGARVGFLLRAYPRILFSNSSSGAARAQVVLRHIADLMRPRPLLPGHEEFVCSVSLETLARWCRCGKRSVQTALQDLTKAGWPLLKVNLGRPGRASEYCLVSNPFAFAEKQAVQAEALRKQRQFAAAKKQAAAMQRGAKGEISNREAYAKAQRAAGVRDRNLPTMNRNRAVVAANRQGTAR